MKIEIVTFNDLSKGDKIMHIVNGAITIVTIRGTEIYLHEEMEEDPIIRLYIQDCETIYVYPYADCFKIV